jgi:hypothetical protein
MFKMYRVLYKLHILSYDLHNTLKYVLHKTEITYITIHENVLT